MRLEPKERYINRSVTRLDYEDKVRIVGVSKTGYKMEHGGIIPTNHLYNNRRALVESSHPVQKPAGYSKKELLALGYSDYDDLLRQEPDDVTPPPTKKPTKPKTKKQSKSIFEEENSTVTINRKNDLEEKITIDTWTKELAETVVSELSEAIDSYCDNSDYAIALNHPDGTPNSFETVIKDGRCRVMFYIDPVKEVIEADSTEFDYMSEDSQAVVDNYFEQELFIVDEYINTIDYSPALDDRFSVDDKYHKAFKQLAESNPAVGSYEAYNGLYHNDKVYLLVGYNPKAKAFYAYSLAKESIVTLKEKNLLACTFFDFNEYYETFFTVTSTLDPEAGFEEEEEFEEFESSDEFDEDEDDGFDDIG